MPRKRRFLPFKERLLKATSIQENGCWTCTLGGSVSRYGKIKLDGTRTGISNHRASWLVHKGPIPEDQCVLHTCDTPRCINPDHLFLGSHADNVADRVTKGRNSDQKGEKGARSYLKEQQVLEIRFLWAAGYSRSDIANMYGTPYGNVKNILLRKTWTYI
jgi:hypothetical protein